MSHPEQQAFFALLARQNDHVLDGGSVLEIGSYDVNGSVRSIFSRAAKYVGVDLEAGPGVDVIAFGHEYEAVEGSFDVTISGECFEHDPHWRESFTNMMRLTRPGGLVAFTCASRGRPEHGTRRTMVRDSPGTQALGLDYYQNLIGDDFADMPLSEWFALWSFWYMPTSMDLYFAGVRLGESSRQATRPLDSEVESIRKLMPLPHRAVRFPLRIVGLLVGHGDRYQRIVLPYWSALYRRFGDQAARG